MGWLNALEIKLYYSVHLMDPYWKKSFNYALQDLEELFFMRKLSPTSPLVGRHICRDSYKYPEQEEGACIAQQLYAEKMGWTL